MNVLRMAIVAAGMTAAMFASAALAADDPHQSKSNADRTTKDCVEVHAAGRSGKIQVLGGGVHLVVEAEQASDREPNDLEALAQKIAGAVCGNAAADKEEADATAAADALHGMDVLHHNTQGSDD